MRKIIYIILISIIGYLLIFCQTYIIQYDIRNNLSSTCPNYSFFKEIAVISLLFFIIILLSNSFLTFADIKKAIANTINNCIYILSSFFMCKEIYFSRVTSWSTFTDFEINIYVFQKSFIMIIIGALFYFLSSQTLKKYLLIK